MATTTPSLSADPLYFSGAAVEPVNSPSWERATDAQKLWYYQGLATAVENEKRKEFLRDIDRHGDRLKPRKHPRSDGANGPVLSPHRKLSRSVRLMRTNATSKGVRLYWLASGRKPWGVRGVLGYHARGEGRYGRIAERDTLGLTKQAQARAVASARTRWRNRYGMVDTLERMARESAARNLWIGGPQQRLPRGGAGPAPKPKPKPKPKPTPRPTPLPAAARPPHLDPSLPIPARLAAWGEGDQLVASIAGLDSRERSAILAGVDRARARAASYAGPDGRIRGDLRPDEREELQRARAEIGAARVRLEIVMAENAERLAAILKIPANRRLKVEHPWVVADADTKARIRDTHRALASVTRHPTGGKPLAVAYRVMDPKPGQPPRSYYTPDRKEVRLSPGAPVSTIAHELGHAIENQIPGARAAATAFLAHRVKDEPLRPLASLFPDHGFAADETGRSDEFGRYFAPARAYYAGKPYPKTGDTEILSMGIEALLTDPAGFAAADPEYAKFVIGVLRGDLR